MIEIGGDLVVDAANPHHRRDVVDRVVGDLTAHRQDDGLRGEDIERRGDRRLGEGRDFAERCLRRSAYCCPGAPSLTLAATPAHCWTPPAADGFDCAITIARVSSLATMIAEIYSPLAPPDPSCVHWMRLMPAAANRLVSPVKLHCSAPATYILGGTGCVVALDMDVDALEGTKGESAHSRRQRS